MLQAQDLHGVSVALLTPFTPEGRVDVDAVGRIAGRCIAAGVAAVSPAGSTGEGALLTAGQRDAMLEATVDVASGVPVVAAVLGQAPTATVADVHRLAELGAAAALVAPPSYYPLAAAETESFFAELADRSPVPLLLYNIPQFTKISIPPGAVGRLARHPRIIAIKDSSRDFEYFEQVVAATASEEFTALTGSDTMLLGSLAVGGHGALAASLNVAPELAVELHQLATKGDLVAAAAVQRRILELVSACRTGSFPAGWKAAAELLGLASAKPAPPLSALPDDLRRQLAAELQRLGYLPRTS